MRKTYQLAIEGKNRDRLLDAAKHDIRKYLKRERAKTLPKEADFWDFDCKSGASEATAQAVPVAELFTSVDALLKEGGDQFYVEVLAKPAQRPAPPPRQEGGNDHGGPDNSDFGDED
jgi:Family of unknown function (DUF6172)